MKRMLAILIAAVFFIGTGLGTWSFAQGTKGTVGEESMKKGMMMEPEEMEEYKMMKHGKMMGRCPMMKTMMDISMIAAPDGGIIVLAGNKLMKYDKDLNLVKEVEIKIDLTAVQKNMMEMMKNCPMMKGGMMGGAMMEKGMGTKPAENK